jgi:plastocyanin
MKRRFFTILIATALAAVFAFGCGNNKSTNSNPPPPPTGNTVSISGFAFSPSSLTISAGDSVTWTNHDAVAHTTTSNTGVWNSGSLSQNQSFTFRFMNAGTYPYHCAIHTTMTGTIVVQ